MGGTKQGVVLRHLRLFYKASEGEFSLDVTLVDDTGKCGETAIGWPGNKKGRIGNE